MGRKLFAIRAIRMSGILVGAIVLICLMLGNSVAKENKNTSNWEHKPIVVNIQVNLDSEDDKNYVNKILAENDKNKSYATVFVTGKFASKYPEVIKAIEARGHQIAVHGWQKGEDISSLKAEEQFKLIQKAFSAVRSVVDKPEEIVDFKPQGYKFNDDTIRILQKLGARSISGIFSSEESFMVIF